MTFSAPRLFERPRCLAEDMFRFNAQVMGFGSGGWMEQILNSFNDIVLNAADAVRLHEECDLLSLRLDKVSKGQARQREQAKCDSRR